MKQEDREMTFADFALATPILNALKKIGFTKPTPIQQQVVPLVLEKRDVVGQAHTGTGKTAAFGLPAVHYVYENRHAQVLVLTPVRELAAQICDELYRYGSETGLNIVTIHGGRAYSRQIEQVRSGAQIIVATPGRLLDLLESNKLSQFKPALVIIDEADEMLDKGFLDDIKAILSHLPDERQTLLFSATMPEPIKALAKKFLKNPEFVHVGSKERTNVNIEQFYCLVQDGEREDALVRLLDTEPRAKTIVFCNTKKEVDHLSGVLVQREHQAFALHGDMEQSQRQKILGSFRRNQHGVLIATEVAARGLNMEDVTHVINYELPYGSESYVHRIGRTGRAGKEGKSITFVMPKQFYAFERLCKTLNVTAQYLPIPNLAKAKALKQKVFLQQLEGISVQAHARDVLQQLQRTLQMEEIALRLLMLTVKEDMVTGPDVIGMDVNSWQKKPGSRSPQDRKPFKKREFYGKKAGFSRSSSSSSRGR